MAAEGTYVRRSTPVRRSLLEVKSTAGAELMPVVVNVTITGMMLMGPRLLWWLVVMYFVHQLLKYLFTVDQQMFAVLRKYLFEGDVYDPWPRPGMRNKRPYGMVRELPLC